MFLYPLLRPHHFVVAGIVCHTCLSVRTFLCKYIIVERRILKRAAGQQISAWQKQSAASKTTELTRQRQKTKCEGYNSKPRVL